MSQMHYGVCYHYCALVKYWVSGHQDTSGSQCFKSRGAAVVVYVCVERRRRIALVTHADRLTVCLFVCLSVRSITQQEGWLSLTKRASAAKIN